MLGGQLIGPSVLALLQSSLLTLLEVNPDSIKPLQTLPCQSSAQVCSTPSGLTFALAQQAQLDIYQLDRAKNEYFLFSRQQFREHLLSFCFVHNSVLALLRKRAAVLLEIGSVVTSRPVRLPPPPAEGSVVLCYGQEGGVMLALTQL